MYNLDIIMESTSGVKKGTWSKEEDDLLRDCIQRYGEGKWRLVPQRAGLNRCQKSCRLRWLNHLKPDIKRGNLTEDEADMIVRFHKLLGNRWSLIAARFPGRTSNDVKNYWNSHIRKKLKQEETAKRHQVIRPRPVTLSRVTLPAELAAANTCDHKSDDGGGRDNKPVIIAADDSDSNKSDESGELAVVGADSSAQESAEKIEEWWESLLLDDNDDEVINKENEGDSVWCLGGEEHEFLLAHQFRDDPTTSSVSLKFE